MTILRALALVAVMFMPGWLAVSLLKGEEESLDGGEGFFLVFVLGMGIVALAALFFPLCQARPSAPLCNGMAFKIYS